ncbi:monovalent cation/H(+) antiporter subunit G [Oceanisphaera avium]|uniref:Na+/H+ antiporter subunit G n=1 Tax=Oceanisphaera avium TaxID=1903694 RepID=A0A1Y0CZK1_9GAMM|nr:monovalent cation/H(+) antiporter subunit G [Oceanisphaera avium]ART80424.1 Na+/H+ antiporter subunit G [Oceanisphaera avium]
MTELLTSAFLLLGAFLMLLSGIGIIRMPDLLTRMHATSKAGALGIGLMTCGYMIFYSDSASLVVRALAMIVFVIVTAPIAAHVLARAGYFVGIELWEGTIKDVIKERYDLKTRRLGSAPKPRDDEETY